MFNFRTIAVIKREIREKLLSKAFIIMTILMPVLMFGIIGIQVLVFSYEGDDNVKLIMLSDSEQLTDNIRDEFLAQEFVTDGRYSIIYQTIEKDSLESFVKQKKQSLLSEKLTGVFYIPSTSLKDKKIDYYSKTPNNPTIFDKIRSPLNKVLVDYYFTGKEVSDDDLQFARSSVDLTGFKITEKEEIEEEGEGAFVLSFILTFLFYISLLMMGQIMMQSVIEEKSSKVVEVLLSSVNAKELLTGKILGTVITGILQMLIWFAPIILVTSTSIFALPPEIIPNIDPLMFIYILFTFAIGLLTFVALFATVGSIFETPQEAQSGVWPVMMLIIIPFLIGISFARNPASPIGIIASMLPFASIIVMPSRLALVEVPLFQLLISAAVNIGTLFFIFSFAGKIYRIGILRTGKKPTWREVIKWIKYKN